VTLTQLGLPEEDRVLSAHTGWTRAHWERVADYLLDNARKYATPKQAQIHFAGGRPSMHGRLSDGLEGYARTFLLAAFRLAGAGGDAPGDLAQRYAEGLAAGVSPDGDEAWPRITDYSQPMVEASSIAIGLYETRPWIWGQLPDDVRGQAVEWFAQVHDKRYWPNNWLLFRVMVNAFLKSVGAPYRQDEIERDLDLIDTMYRRNGWYTDGPGNNYDYYVGWAIHLYTMLWCRMDGNESHPARAAVYRDRVRRYLEDYPYFFGADGRNVYHGRSLIYRFGAVTPFWLGALAGTSPLPAGMIRRIASGVVKHFLEAGAASHGYLSMGWHGEFLPMAQQYSGPASPSGASNGFLGLLLPADHKIWTAPEEPMPVEQDDFVRSIPEAGFRLHGTRSNGIVRMATHKSDHYPEPGALTVNDHYCRLSYSTHTAPDIASGDSPVDSSVVLIDPDGNASSRARFHTIAVADRLAASTYFPGEQQGTDNRPFLVWWERIETLSIARGDAEIRVHYVSTLGRRTLRDGGFAAASDDPLAIETGDGWSLVRTADGLVSFVTGIHGFERAEVHRSEGVNPFGRYSAAPAVTTGRLPAEAILVSLVVLTQGGLDPVRARADIASVEVSGRQVKLRCADGEEFFVQAVAPEHLEIELGGKLISGAVRYARVSPDGSSFVLEG
jgi:hypothetical protein